MNNITYSGKTPNFSAFILLLAFNPNPSFLLHPWIWVACLDNSEGKRAPWVWRLTSSKFPDIWNRAWRVFLISSNLELLYLDKLSHIVTLPHRNWYSNYQNDFNSLLLVAQSACERTNFLYIQRRKPSFYISQHFIFLDLCLISKAVEILSFVRACTHKTHANLLNHIQLENNDVNLPPLKGIP